MFRDASGLLAEIDVLGYLPWALSGLARARARAGQEESAVAAMAEARRRRTTSRHYDTSLYLAEIEIDRMSGRQAAAVETARAATIWARQAGMVLDEAIALDAWVRIDPSDEIADRLAELAEMTDSRFTAALAEHARALVDGQAEALLELGERFAGMSAWWHAAEAASAAAWCLDRQHQDRAASAAARAAERYADNCEGTRPGPMPGHSSPTRLTKREQEIATLAAGGRSTKEIAEQMFVSQRTVENHLHRAYVKLGVSDRAALAEVLTPGGSAE
jgi:DNA-binding CsgD family transcriptional regulator